MNPNFQIGPLSFHFYGLILSIALFTTFVTAKLQAVKEKIPEKIIEELAIVLIIPTILGARAYHVVHYWDFYSKNPAQIFYIWQGGIGIIGALILGLVVLILYSKWKKLDFLKLADVAAPAVVLGQSIGRVGNFVNLEGFGPPTNLPWAIYVEPFRRPDNLANFEKFHPTFFYEAAGDFLIFLILAFFPAKKTGGKFALYLILYSLLRAGLEFLRIDTWQIGIVKVAQIIAIFGFLAGLIILVKVLKPSWIPRFFI